MSKNDASLTDSEWEAEFNGPRERLLKQIFGNIPCPVKDLSPRVIIKDENWTKGIDFMKSDKPRILNNSGNSDTRGIAEWNAQMHNGGRIVSVMRDDQLSKLAEKPKPIK